METIDKNIAYREMLISDHANLIKFWESIQELHIDETDTFENLNTYLNRNPQLSYVAIIGEEIVGTIKCAQDGRRGYISHMAVSPKYRNLGIAKELYTKAINELINQKIWKVNLYVLDENPKALVFWKNNGWEEVEYDFRTFQKRITE